MVKAAPCVLAALSLLACTRGPTLDSLAYPGARVVIDREVTGRTMAFHYRCYATSDAVAMVTAHYDAEPGLTHGTFRVAAGEAGFAARRDPDLHVAVFPAESLPQHRQCEGSLAAGDRTVVQVTAGRPAP